MIDCDFIPPAFHERQRVRRTARTRMACIAVMFALMGLWWLVHRHRLGEAQAMLSEVTMQKSQIDMVAAKKSVLEAERARLADRQRLMRQLSDRASLVVVLGQISRILPERIVLTECSLYAPLLSDYADGEGGRMVDGADARATAKDGAPALPVGLRIAGAAASLNDVLRLAAEIEADPLFGRVSLNTGAPGVWARRRAQMFEMVCELVPQEVERP